VNKDYPCTCTHFKKDHEYRKEYFSKQLQRICWQCMRLMYDEENREYKPYHKFIPDNLRYLEIKANEI